MVRGGCVELHVITYSIWALTPSQHFRHAGQRLRRSFEVAFIRSSVSPTSTIFWINYGVHVIFLKDLVLTFFLKVEVERTTGYGSGFISDAVQIRLRYLRVWFSLI